MGCKWERPAATLQGRQTPDLTRPRVNALPRPPAAGLRTSPETGYAAARVITQTNPRTSPGLRHLASTAIGDGHSQHKKWACAGQTEILVLKIRTHKN